MRPNPEIFREANRLDSLGLLPLPLIEGSKKPAVVGWQQIHRNRLAELFEEPRNLGLAMGQLVTVDFDTKPEAREFFKRYQSVIRCIQETRRGAHFLFRAGREIRNTQGSEFDGLGYDLRGEGGYIVTAPSQVEDHVYHYVKGYELRDPKRLEVIPDELIPPKKQTVQVATSEGMVRILKAQKYISKIRSGEVNEGSQGDRTCFRVCCKLRDFGLSESEAWPLLCLWNHQKAVQPANEKKLRHDLQGAYSRK